MNRLLALLGVCVVAVLAVLTGGGPVAAEERGPSAHVVVVGVPGLRWDDLDPDVTPGLWQLAGTGTVGALSVRAATSVTCPADGWVTLGAGNRARAAAHGPRECPDGALPPVQPTGPDGSARVDARALIARNDALDFDAEVGALGELLHRRGECVSAAGPGAAVAAMDRSGAVDHYRPGPDSVDRAFLDACALTIVQASGLEVGGRTATARAAVDRTVRNVRRSLPPGSLLLVVGVSELSGEVPHLHVAIAAGSDLSGGELRSPSTRRAPFLQLIDVAPTVAAQLGAPQPTAFTGQSAVRSGAAAETTTAEVARLRDQDRAAAEQRRLVPPFFSLLVVGQFLLYPLAWMTLRRLQDRPRRDRLLRRTGLIALACAAAPVATYLANLVPWWRAGHPLGAVLLAVAAAAVAVIGLALAGPWRRHLLGPAGVVAGVTALVLAGDVVSGARLQMDSLAGYSPLVAGRFAGFGNVAYAVFATGALLATAVLAAGRSRRTTLVLVSVAGLVAVAVDGSPIWGSDFGGVIALVPAYAVLGMLLIGMRLSWWRMGLALLAGAVTVTTFALLDHSRPAAQQTHLGRFVGQLADGSAATVVRRKAEANLHLLTHSVLTLLLPLAILILVTVLLRPQGALRLAFARQPAFRAGLVAVLVMGLIGMLVNDSGVAIPALAMTVAIPLAVAVSAEALRRTEREAAGESEQRPPRAGVLA